MKAVDFEKLKDFILEKNACFNHGFANAYKDVETNGVYVREGNDLKPLLPNDTLGNYFYLRNEMTVRHEPQFEERLTDNGAQRLKFRDGITIYMVALLHNADVYALQENLRNTVMMYESLTVLPVTTSWNREQVLKEEMTGMKKEDVVAALQRLKDEVIVKITLQVFKDFIPGKCINEI